METSSLLKAADLAEGDYSSSEHTDSGACPISIGIISDLGGTVRPRSNGFGSASPEKLTAKAEAPQLIDPTDRQSEESLGEGNAKPRSTAGGQAARVGSTKHKTTTFGRNKMEDAKLASKPHIFRPFKGSTPSGCWGPKDGRAHHMRRSVTFKSQKGIVDDASVPKVAQGAGALAPRHGYPIHSVGPIDENKETGPSSHMNPCSPSSHKDTIVSVASRISTHWRTRKSTDSMYIVSKCTVAFNNEDIQCKALQAADRLGAAMKAEGCSRVKRLWHMQCLYLRTLWSLDYWRMIKGSAQNGNFRAIPTPRFRENNREELYVHFLQSIMPIRLTLGSILLLFNILYRFAVEEIYAESKTIQQEFSEAPNTLRSVHLVLQCWNVVGFSIMGLLGFSYAFMSCWENFAVFVCFAAGLGSFLEGTVMVYSSELSRQANQQAGKTDKLVSTGLRNTAFSLLTQLLVVFLLFPVRVIKSWIVLAWYMLLYFGLCVYAIIMEARWDHIQQVESAIQLGVFFFTVAVLALIAKYDKEISTRAIWQEWLRSNSRVHELEDHFLKTEKKPRSGLEMVLKHLSTAIGLVLNARKAGSFTADQMEFLEQTTMKALEILLKQKDLMSVNLSQLPDTFPQHFLGLCGHDAGATSCTKSFVHRNTRGRSFAIMKSSCLSLTTAQLNLAADKVGQEWNTNILVMSKTLPDTFLVIGCSLLGPLLPGLGVEENVLLRFLRRAENKYTNNPYHSSVHGAEVAHLFHCLVTMFHLSAQLDDWDLATVVISGLCHDVGHPGRNNAFLVSTGHMLALRYNDLSVLENYHAALTFELLDEEGCNVLINANSDVRREVRKNLIDMILSTDMKRHFDEMSLFRALKQNPEFDPYQSRDDMWRLLKMCIKAADLGHGALDWEQHYEWCMRVTEEFWQQGDEEASRGIQISFLCDREKDKDVPKSQPLFEELAACEPWGDRVREECINYLKTNIANWQGMANSESDEPRKISQHVVDNLEVAVKKETVAFESPP